MGNPKIKNEIDGRVCIIERVEVECKPEPKAQPEVEPMLKELMEAQKTGSKVKVELGQNKRKFVIKDDNKVISGTVESHGDGALKIETRSTCSLNSAPEKRRESALELRKEGYTQQEIAEKVGYSQPYISKLLNSSVGKMKR